MAGFIVKVFVMSTLIGAFIKHGAPLLDLTPSLGLCLILLLSPVGLMAALFWQQAT